MMRTAALLSVVAGCAADLSANTLGAAQELMSLVPSVCSNRSSECSILMDVPEGCAGKKSACPIAFFFHGHGGRNVMFPHQQPGVFDYSFIGLYPQGELYNGRSGWNDGSMDGNKCAYNDYSCTLDPNDATFVAGLISTMRSLGANGRVYAYGSSNGANEVQILAANAVVNPTALPIAGIAANSGQLLAKPTRSGPAPYDYNQPCAGTQPCGGGGVVAQLSIHGTADGVIHYDGGSRLGSDVFILMAEEDSDAVWAAQNGCSATSSSANITASGRPVGDTTATHFAYKGCPATAPVELYKVFDVQHVATQSLGGEPMMGVVLDFFEKVEAAHAGSLVEDA